MAHSKIVLIKLAETFSEELVLLLEFEGFLSADGNGWSPSALFVVWGFEEFEGCDVGLWEVGGRGWGWGEGLWGWAIGLHL